ncbi:MAG: hypothetical protein MUP27_01675, partial [Desulfobacterales bacterium]|nr:hypothetical protein [Desulfobacterales bacterium]
ISESQETFYIYVNGMTFYKPFKSSMEKAPQSQYIPTLRFSIVFIGRWVASNGAPSVVRPTLLYISSEAVIPAKAGIQIENTGFRVKPGMTIKVKGLLTQYTSVER